MGGPPGLGDVRDGDAHGEGNESLAALCALAFCVKLPLGSLGPRQVGFFLYNAMPHSNVRARKAL